MTAGMLDEIVRFLDALEEAHEELSVLFARKWEALTVGRCAEIDALTDREIEIQRRLQRLAATRERLLQQAAMEQLPTDSVRRLAAVIGGEALEPRIRRAGHTAARLRRAAWAHWIFAQRSSHHYGQMLDLIARAGQVPPTYTTGPDRGTTTGGAILDAAA